MENELNINQLEGVGPVTVKKLEAFGVKSLIDICIRGSKEVAEITGTAKAKSDQWCFNAMKILEEKELIRKTDMSTVELMRYHNDMELLPSKCKSIDELMGGGLKSECVYEVYGEFGSGKTQFCLSLLVESIAQGMNVVWIDCEDTFRPNRVLEILKSRMDEDGDSYSIADEDLEKLLEHIDYIYTPNTEQLMGTINGLSDIMEAKKPRLVVIDGSIGQFREEYLGRGTLADRQNQIARLMTHIKNISFYFRCTVLFTNQVQSDPSIMFGDPTKPIGGNVVGHASTYRMYFKKSGRKRIARMVDSPEHPQGDAPFTLNTSGIADVED
jgi:DNA repair protein RadA